ncbi:hypothetical protein BC834DRAFT_201577 [Gloeopeniophorella convolvens]|nr:hypothetical protein BC834DRAFT_201577 [Gloeopeniophorella convolvens]
MASAAHPRDPEAQREAGTRRGSLARMFVVEKDGDKGSEYGDTSAQMWNLYGLESEKYDKALVESWMGNTNSMLIFTGLFSTIVASLLIETYKTLRVDSGPETVALLIQVISQSNISRPSSTPIGGSQPTTATASAVRINILMFLSLFLSVSSALASTLVQQWARDYLQYSQPNAAPHKRGRVRAYMFSGLSQFQMRRFIEGVPVLLHASVFLFFWALSDFLHTIDAVVGLVARYSLVALLAVYMTLSISPLISGNSPYQTALTTPIKALVLIIHSFLTAAKRLARTTSPNLSQGDSGSSRAIKLNREVVLMDEANSRAPELDRFALHWLLQKLDGGDMDEFLKGLPGYVSSPLTEAKNLAEGLAAEHILRRIREHFTACVMSFELSEEACMSRVLACVSSLRLIFESSGTRTGGSDAGYIRAIIEHLDELCKRPDSVVALRASSVRCLAFHGFLIPYVRTDLQSLSDQRFPDYLVPLYAFLRTRKNTSSGQWRDLPTTLQWTLSGSNQVILPCGRTLYTMDH